MYPKTRVSSFVLLLLLLSAGASFAVTVPGHDGTSLPLSQIPDIIRHVTGQTSGDLSLGKDSLFLMDILHNKSVQKYSDVTVTETMIKLSDSLYTFDSDGNKIDMADTEDPSPLYSDKINPDYCHLSAAGLSAKNHDGTYSVLQIAPAGDWHIVSGGMNSGGDVTMNSIRLRSPSSDSYTGSVVDAEAGITVKGYDGELVALLMRDGETFSVYLAKVSADSNPASSNAELVSGSWSATTGSSGNVPKMLDGTIYYPLSMAVGDFDNDGYANEIAVVNTNRIAVHYHVLQISHTGSSAKDANFSVSVLNNGDVGSYGYGGWEPQYTGRYLNMDGITCTFSICTVAGDFDGDGKTEFAVVWRDTSPNDSIFTNFAGNNSLFVGYTGKIHVKTYKWNGSTFQTEEDVRGFDMDDVVYGDGGDDRKWNNIDLPLGVKAAVGDFDGDGHDDIAVLRVMLQYTEQRGSDFQYSNFVFGAFVDWYTFDKDSIKPKYNGHSNSGGKWNYGDSKNGWVGIRTTGMGMPWFDNEGISNNDPSQGNQNKIRRRYYLSPITGEQNPYPLIDREFDLIAGKFSGRVGTVKTCDDLVIKYPQWSDSDGNKLRSHVALMTNIPGVTNWGTQVHEITSLSDRDHLLAFAKADYLNEGVTLGDPVRVTDTSDLDYTAILQMFPYHVDNLTSDGTALQKDPQNCTLRLNTAVTYKNTSSSSETKNLSYNMIKTAETIFALDNPALRTASKTFQGIRGITTAVLGDNDTIKKMDGIGKIWDKLKDTTQTTTTKSNENSTSYTMSITTSANYQDTLYMNQSNRYIWRYPIQEVPAPAWLIGQNKDTSASFDASQAMNQRSYITFAMSEPAMPTSAVGINDSHYHPYHELGNLFSYPATIEQTEGYEGRKSLTDSTYSGPIRWNGAEFKQEISLSTTSTDQENTKKVNKPGAITKFLSVIDNIFGSSMASIPQNSESSYSRSVTDGESISINIPAAYSGARFTAVFETYLDVAGTMTSAFAVENFNRDDALWGNKSLYTLKPDPSLLLPEKFDYVTKKDSEWDRAVFTGNDNDPTAMKMRGVRFKVASYDIDSDNLLLKGLKYTISVPVYNASFKDADHHFKVRLSYAKTNDYNAPKTKIDEYTFAKLPGWGGNSRQYATFTWTPNIDDGIYYLFAEIDPDNAIDEVHENRRNASGDIIDYGGNNMGYWRIGVAASDSLTFDRTELENAEFHAAASDGSAFPYVHWVKADGLDLEDFIKQKVDGATKPVPVEVELEYGGEYVMTEARLIGYKLKPEAKSKDVSAVTDEDIGLVFVNANFDILPGEEHKLHFRINPMYLEDGIGFVLLVHGEEYPLTDIIYGSAGSSSGSGVASASSGGCSSGFGGLAVVLALMMRKKK